VKKALAVGVLLLAWLLGPKLVKSISARATASEDLEGARARVTDVLDAMKKDGVADTALVQRAICRWYNGSGLQPADVLASQLLKYYTWLREKDFFRKIQSYQVGSIDKAGGESDRALLVHVTIEGRPYTIVVEPDRPLRWAK